MRNQFQKKNDSDRDFKKKKMESLSLTSVIGLHSPVYAQHMGDSYITPAFRSPTPTLPKHLLVQGCIFQSQNLKDYKVGVAKASERPLCVKVCVKSIGNTHIGTNKA